MLPTVLWKLLRAAALVLAVIWLTLQVRKPSGWLGRRMVRAMNLGHAAMTDWALQQITIAKDASVLDIGFGGGRTVRKLVVMAPAARVVGVDYSPASVAVSRETNAEEIDNGRVRIELASVVALPFSDRTFDVVTAVETHYYWPNLRDNVREVRRVLKPGGTFALIAETYRGGPFRLLYAIVMPLLRAAFLTDEQHRDVLVGAGFTDVETRHRSGRKWILAIGRRGYDC